MLKKQLYATVIVFSLCTGLVFAEKKAKKDRMAGVDNYVVAEDVMTLSQIDKLIKDTNYDKAMEELNKYIAQYPENFDNAQTRINRIMNARNRYSQLAEELIQVVTEDPDNDERIYQITYQLEHLEKYPSDQQLAFIKDIYIAAEFNHFRKEFIRINDETDTLIKSGSYVAAVNKAHEGFNLYQERFYDEVTDEGIINSVNNAISQIEENMVLYEQLQGALTDCVFAFVNAVESENRTEINTALKDVTYWFSELADIRNRIENSGNVFNDNFAVLKEMSGEELTDASFLPFIRRFTLGQADNEYSGIAGAMSRQWDLCLNRMKNSVDGKVSKYVTMFKNSLPAVLMESRLSDLNVSGMQDLNDFSKLAVSLNSLNDRLSPDRKADMNEAYKASAVYAYALPERIISLYDYQKDILSRADEALSMKIPENPSEAELSKNNFSSGYLNAILKIDPAASTNSGSFEVLSEENLASDENLSVMTSHYLSYLNELGTFAYDAEAKANGVFCTYLRQSDDGYITLAQNARKEAESNFHGIENENQIIRKYPEKALKQANELSEKIDSYIGVINRHIALLPKLPDQEMASETETSLEENIISLNALKSLTMELAEHSKTQIQTAAKARNEAELRLRQAEAALEDDDFEAARKRLQDSRTRFNDALALSFSEELQADSDSRLLLLGEEVTQKENEIVVRDVRKLKTQAKNEYYAGNFEAAENYLTQASARWSVTNVEEDQEISGLRALVNSALSMKTGRVILPSAPLYPEMSQILSVASQYYNEGEDLIKDGKRDEGVAELQKALRKIQEVQLVYPLNQEASLLSLRVQKVLNPAEFDSMFSRKVSEAKANYKVAAKQQESYADLLDLYEINPKYPGLKNLIFDVEIEIGIRKRQVTKVVSAKSTDLTKEAQSLISKAKGDEDKLKSALAKLDEAISMNPENEQAMNLKDQLQVSIGGKASAVLSSEDENRYQQAIQAFSNNNYITANAIVEQLLQKQSNKNSTKILELQKKIKALL